MDTKEVQLCYLFVTYFLVFLFFAFLIYYWMCGTYNVEPQVVNDGEIRHVQPDEEEFKESETDFMGHQYRNRVSNEVKKDFQQQISLQMSEQTKMTFAFNDVNYV
jgi:hypothetical protein